MSEIIHKECKLLRFHLWIYFCDAAMEQAEELMVCLYNLVKQMCVLFLEQWSLKFVVGNCLRFNISWETFAIDSIGVLDDNI